MTSGGTGRFSFFVFEYHRRARKGPTRTRRTGCDSRQSTSYCVGTHEDPFYGDNENPHVDLRLYPGLYPADSSACLAKSWSP